VRSLTRSIGSLLGPLGRLITSRAARILVYHRFGNGPRRLATGQFEAHLAYIAKHFRPRRLTDVVARLHQGRPFEPKTVVITVDDGYEDFYSHAYPLLKSYDIPATVFLVSDFIDVQQWLWFDLLQALFHKAAEGHYEMLLQGNWVSFDLSCGSSRIAAWSQVAEICLDVDSAARTEIVRAVQASLGVELPERPTQEYQPMTWDQIRSMSSEIVDIGAHTISHPLLSRCVRSVQHAEIAGSKTLIEERIGRKVESFAYPNGLAQDFTEETVSLVRGAGLSSAVTTCPGLVRHDAHPYRLPRISADDLSQFRNCVNGLTSLARSVDGRGLQY
jgi:peptidoglycan/xylan/chitin deacetylase (PgdA/CDA1 family)